jgi:hypothetical protein
MGFLHIATKDPRIEIFGTKEERASKVVKSS